jgi:hypothetical protein
MVLGHVLSHLLIFPPFPYTVVGVEMADRAEELQVFDMAFPLSEPVEFALGTVPVEGFEVMDLQFAGGPAMGTSAAQALDDACAFPGEVLVYVSRLVGGHFTFSPPEGTLPGSFSFSSPTSSLSKGNTTLSPPFL